MIDSSELDSISEADLINEITTEKKQRYKNYISNAYTIISIVCFFLLINYHYSNVTFAIFYTVIILLLVYKDNILEFIYSVYEIK